LKLESSSGLVVVPERTIAGRSSPHIAVLRKHMLDQLGDDHRVTTLDNGSDEPLVMFARTHSHGSVRVHTIDTEE
jgi:hypothetical protein